MGVRQNRDVRAYYFCLSRIARDNYPSRGRYTLGGEMKKPKDLILGLGVLRVKGDIFSGCGDGG